MTTQKHGREMITDEQLAKEYGEANGFETAQFLHGAHKDQLAEAYLRGLKKGRLLERAKIAVSIKCFRECGDIVNCLRCEEAESIRRGD